MQQAARQQQQAAGGSKAGVGYAGSAYMNRIGNRRQEAATESVDSARGRGRRRGGRSSFALLLK